MTPKAFASVLLLSTLLILYGEARSVAAHPPKFGLRIGAGLLWAPEDKENLAGKSLYRQHYPFHVEFCYGRYVKGVLGLSHFFSQEEEHTEGGSLIFTPRLRQYAVHLGIQAQQDLMPYLRIHGELGGGVFWRSYNPGWKDKSYWDKAKTGILG
jgi:hypothetical protein